MSLKHMWKTTTTSLRQNMLRMARKGTYRCTNRALVLYDMPPHRAADVSRAAAQPTLGGAAAAAPSLRRRHAAAFNFTKPMVVVNIINAESQRQQAGPWRRIKIIITGPLVLLTASAF